MRFWGSLLGWVLAVSVQAQYAHEWIQPSQTYYKIKVAREGIYRLTFADLKAAGFPAEVVDPRLIQLFHRGKEQAILFKHNQTPADARFEEGEYFEFYGQRNDGTLDAQLYQPVSAQPHRYYNLYSDTTAYFITWRDVPQPGKRMEAIDLVNSTNQPKETFQIAELLQVLTTDYSGGTTLSDVIQPSTFNEGEGWTGPVICTQNSGCTGQQDFQLAGLDQRVITGGPPRLEVQVVGRDDLPHQVSVYAGPSAGSLRLIATQTFENFETPVIAADIAWADVAADGKLLVRVVAEGVAGLRERVSVSYLRVAFPQGFDLAGVSEKKLGLPIHPQGRSYVEWTNAPAGARVFDITSPEAVATIGTRPAGAALSAVVPGTTIPRKLLIASLPLGASAVKIEPVSFQLIDPEAYDYLIITHARLRQPALGLGDPVQSYADYRASEAGGGYRPLVLNVSQLYDQFNYGEISPLAIYAFARWMVEQGDPRFLFFIGKGREVHAGFHRKTSLAAGEYRDLVPPAGTPASDMAFTAGLRGEAHVPAVPTGRLTASTPAEVAAYLNKVVATETQPANTLWRKRILHLSGGIQANELTLFRIYMNGFASIAEGPLVGGRVATVGKHDPDPVQFINISEEINQGVNLVTFFGHSASNSTDIDIGRVSEPQLGYNNPGRYPAFLVNGCNAGEFFNNGKNFGEDWILASEKGARNFIANSSFGFSGLLRFYTELFYQVGFADEQYLNRGIGEVQAEVARRMVTISSNLLYIAQAHQMVLLGDPALRLFAPSKPDLETDNASVFVTTFDNKPFTALSDSVQVNVVVRNLGRTLSEPISVRLSHRFRDQMREQTRQFGAVLFQDTLRFTLVRGTDNFFGDNTIDIALDLPDAWDELSESNNQARWSGFVPFSGTKHLWPPDFGVVGTTQVKLLFQNTNLLVPAATYLFELDTVSSFNSAFLQSKTIAGGVLNSVPVTLADRDSVVYYWRTRLRDEEGAQWENTSFAMVRQAPEGWAQLRGAQLANNGLDGLVRDGTAYRVDFEQTSVSVFLKTFGGTNANSHLNASFQVNGAEFYYSPQGFNCRDNTINLVAFNKSTLVPYRGVPFTFQNSFGRACGREPQIINSFLPSETNTGNGDDLIQYVNNIAPGDSVILFSMGDAGFAAWDATVKTKLGELGIGANAFDNLLPGEPVVILARKGAAPGSATLLRSDLPDPPAQELQLTESLTGRLMEGEMRSVLIGPARAWKRLDYRLRDVQPVDATTVEVRAVRANGEEQVILAAAAPGQNLETIDAAAYPFLRLVLKTSDQTELTAADVRHWIVSFEPLPEGIVAVRQPIVPASLQEGAPWSSSFGFANISNSTFSDSLRVEVEVVNKTSAAVERSSFNILQPAPGDSVWFEVKSNTLSKAGWNDVRVSVNPGIQREQYLPNNTISVPSLFEVLRDQLSPVLDVTVDGRYLVSGDYVSPSPSIQIVLMDENPFLSVDTTAVALLLTYPCSGNCTPTPIHFSRSDVSYEVDVTANKLTVQFKPSQLPEGNYTLWVKATDKSGNPSGSAFYEVSFVVDSQLVVRFSPPYPNPSVNDFFFEFQLNGEQALATPRLEIFDPRGQLVQAFEADAFSTVSVGRQRLVWKATDGVSPLPSGVYFYRLAVGWGGETYTTMGRLLLVR